MLNVTDRQNHSPCIQDSIVLVVKLLNLSKDPAIRCMCLTCIGNIVNMDARWLDPVMATGIVKVITSFEDVCFASMPEA